MQKKHNVREKIACAILAGGQNRRMGRHKAFLDYCGRTFIEVILDNMNAWFDDIFIVTNDKELFLDMPEPVYDTLEGKPDYQKTLQFTKGSSVEELLNVRRQYCAMIELLDTYIGKMVEILKKRNMYDNTLIIICADHGEMLGDHGMYYKSVPYDPSIRIPLIICGPGVEIRGESKTLVQLFDLYPTILEIAGIEVPNYIDAKSLVPILSGKEEKMREYQFVELYDRQKNYQLVCDGRFKFIKNTFEINEMYDRENDPEECHNIIDKYPQIQKKFEGILREMSI